MKAKRRTTIGDAEGLESAISAGALAVFLVLAVIIGGSPSRAHLNEGVLEVLGALLLIWAVWNNKLIRVSQESIGLLGIAAVMFVYGIVQLIPLPPGLWMLLPSHAIPAETIRITGANPPPLPLSLTPEATRDWLLAFLPPLAAFVLTAMVAKRSVGAWIAWAFPAAAMTSVLLGVLQLIDGENSPLYMYEVQNRGYATGFFANVNHQATLMLMSMPFLAAVAAELNLKRATGGTPTAQLAIVLAIASVVLAGLVFAGSMAGYLLLGPAVLASVWVYAGGSAKHARLRWAAIGAAVLIVGGIIALVATNTKFTGLGQTDFGNHELGRMDTYGKMLEAIFVYLPFGSGLGSFEQIYPQFEDPMTVGGSYHAYAHSDYLQIVLEMGVVGLFLIGAVVVWWINATIKAWSGHASSSNRLRRAASLALGLLMLHSVVDYPVRSIAIAVLAAVCAALLASPSERLANSKESETTNGAKQVSL
jgi:O-antigen ligase